MGICSSRAETVVTVPQTTSRPQTPLQEPFTSPESTVQGDIPQEPPTSLGSQNPAEVGNTPVDSEHNTHNSEPACSPEKEPEPITAEDFFFRGNLLAHRKENDEALMAFDEAIKLRPNFPKVLYQRGLVWLELKNLPLALQDFEAALTFNYALAYIGCARVMLEQGQADKALVHINKAHEHRPQDMVVYEVRAEIQHALGRAGAANRDEAVGALLRDLRECVVCMDAARSTRLVPCSHSGMCGTCAEDQARRTNKCPICGQQIERIEFGGCFNATFDPCSSLDTSTSINRVQQAAKAAQRVLDLDLEQLDERTLNALFPEGMVPPAATEHSTFSSTGTGFSTPMLTSIRENQPVWDLNPGGTTQPTHLEPVTPPNVIPSPHHTISSSPPSLPSGQNGLLSDSNFGRTFGGPHRNQGEVELDAFTPDSVFGAMDNGAAVMAQALQAAGLRSDMSTPINHRYDDFNSPSSAEGLELSPSTTAPLGISNISVDGPIMTGRINRSDDSVRGMSEDLRRTENDEAEPNDTVLLSAVPNQRLSRRYDEVEVASPSELEVSRSRDIALDQRNDSSAVICNEDDGERVVDEALSDIVGAVEITSVT